MPNIRQFMSHNKYINNLKRIMMEKEIPRNGVIQCIEIADTDLLLLQMLI